MSVTEKTLTLTGRTLSPGFGEGKTFLYRDVLTRLDKFHDIDDSQVDEELKRLKCAVERSSDDLNVLASRVKKEMDSGFSAVFQAHVAMLQDPSLTMEIEKEIKDERVSAESAVKVVLRRWERRFRSMEAEVARQKADDVQDLARRLVFSLMGIHAHALEKLPPGSVLVATRMLPSDTIFLARRAASAALVEAGGMASHAALFAREIGLPCVSGLTNILEAVPADAYALVDADTARVVINPNQEQKTSFRARREQEERARMTAQARSHEPAITKDGTVVSVLANIGCKDDTVQAIENGAEGVGLYRIEQAYLGRQEPPDTAALLEEMRRVLDPAKGLPVCVRLLDVGADKPLPFMESLNEANPALGRRGIRFLLRYPDLLQTQLDALLQLSSEFDLSILVPMVTLPRDMKSVKELLTATARQSQASSMPKLGAMIETPAATLGACEIAQHAGFLSVGTNDLTQYTFAADRENAAVDAYFDDTHDVIFRLLRTLHDDVPHIPLSICGELAGRPGYTSKILECGITSLSVAPPLIPTIKEAIRQCGAK